MSTAAINKPAPADEAPHILVVDDDTRIRDLLRQYLTNNGYRVTTADSAREARGRMRGLSFDILILDVMMPGETGFELAEALKGEMDIPILMLTARGEPEYRIQGLELGVEDYLAKPFEPRELLLRLHNILRQRQAGEERTQMTAIRIGEFCFHPGRGALMHGETAVHLTERERQLLRIFTSRPGEPVSREELSQSADGASARAIDVQINRLRRKIETDPANPLYLQTVRGKGYILHVE